jgi:predicted phage tail protein
MSEASNTLASRQYGIVVDGVSEGPIGGFVKVYLDGTDSEVIAANQATLAAANSWTDTGVKYEYRIGESEQSRKRWR